MSVWNKILGHKQQIEQIKRIATKGQLANAYLFSGLPGIGKQLVAKTFVKTLFCSSDEKPCDACVACSKIDNLLHPDFFYISPVKEKILIEQVRSLQQSLSFHPMEGNYKITIIDEANKMTESAANSILKILEEPPKHTHFILVSSCPDQILPTIRSRCQQIVFSPLKENEVKNFLTQEMNIPHDQAFKIAGFSSGSIGAVNGLDSEFITDVLDRYKGLMKAANAADIIKTAENWAKEVERNELVLDLLAGFYRDLILEHYLKTNEETSNKKNIKKLEEDFFLIIKTRDILTNTTANKQLLFEQLLFKLTG